MIYIEQPAFLPWLGLCEALLACDSLILLDDVQFSERGWQNRNRIKSAEGVRWLTVPILKRHGQLLRVAPSFNPRAMLETIRHAYGRAEFYQETMDAVADPIEHPSAWLVDLNVELITSIAAGLGSTCKILLASQLRAESGDGKLGRIAALCQAAGDTTLWAGEGTRGYLDTDTMASQGISVVWNEFPHRHPVYRQVWPRQGFVPGLSIVDAVSSVGWPGVSALLKQGVTAHLAKREGPLG
jgi:hypothetical protein